MIPVRWMIREVRVELAKANQQAEKAVVARAHRERRITVPQPAVMMRAARKAEKGVGVDRAHRESRIRPCFVLIESGK